MPYYDLRCESCQAEINIKATIKERSENQLRCPSCGGSQLATVYRKVNVLKFKGKDCDVCPGQSALPKGGGCCQGGACGHMH